VEDQTVVIGKLYDLKTASTFTLRSG